MCYKSSHAHVHFAKNKYWKLYILQHSTISQEVVGWGSLGWREDATSGGPSLVQSLSELGGVKQIACSERCLVALTKAGKVYTLHYNSETQVCILTHHLSEALFI